MGYTLNFAAVWRNFDFLLSGLVLSLGLAVISILIGAAIGLVVAFALTSKSRFAIVLKRGSMSLSFATYRYSSWCFLPFSRCRRWVCASTR